MDHLYERLADLPDGAERLQLMRRSAATGHRVDAVQVHRIAR
jgi:hypothetical protein